MGIPQTAEKNTGKIVEVVIGATPDENGTRSKKITIGGENMLPFHFFEGEALNRPAIAMEVLDYIPEDFPKIVLDEIGDDAQNPATWAKACEEKFGADAICLKLISTDPEGSNRSARAAADTVEAVLGATKLPLILYGCGDMKKDAEVFQACVDIVKNERVVFGSADDENYKSIAAVAMSANASVIAFSNIDVNLAKQLNILLTDFGMKNDRILMDPLMGALGYGLDYSYSVMERIRIGALAGDTMLGMPMICDSGVAWNSKEATDNDKIYGGETEKRGVMWEATTALSALTAGADMLIMRHPKAVEVIRKTLDELTETK